MINAPLPSMRIIYFSNQSPEVVNAVIEGLEALGQQVLMLVTTPGTRARPGNEYKRTVANARRDLDILVTTHMNRLAGMLRPLEPDLIFTTGFSWKLPSELLTLPRLGSVNAHPSLLPRYRDQIRSTTQLRNQVRGWGSQGALASIEGQTYLVSRARMAASPATARPGTILDRTDNTFLIQTGQGALLIKDFKRDE